MTALAVGAVVLLALLLRSRARAPGARAASEEGAEQIRSRLSDRAATHSGQPGGAGGVVGAGRDVLGLAVAGAGAGTAIGGAVSAGAAAGPVGAWVGAVVGFVIVAIEAVVGQETYGEQVRHSLADWIRSEGLLARGEVSSAVDAMLLRNALLTCGHVWHRASDGALAVEVVRVRDDGGVDLSLFGAAERYRAKLWPGLSHVQILQTVARWSPSQLDSASERRANEEWKGRCRAGQLWLLSSYAGRASDTPGYAYFADRSVRVNRGSPVASREGWAKVVPTSGDVDAICATYDRGWGLEWAV